ncbi:MAG: amino acid adenylation domain-containing protein, partial [Sphingopyxis sp.]
MKLEELFSYIQDKNISITVNNDELVIRAPQGLLNLEVKKHLKIYKNDLITAFGSGQIITPGLLTLVNLTQDQIDKIVADVPLGTTNIQDIYPLAPLQEGILFHHQLETQGDAYLARSVLSFESRNHLESFLNAFQHVINRHDILRSAMFWKGLPQPVQVVYRKAQLQIEELLLSTNTINEADFNDYDYVLQELLERTNPHYIRLNLQEAPLIKTTIASIPHSSECLLAILNHHLIIDHVTLEMIIAEIQMIMQGQIKQLPIPLPYRNFIAKILSVSPSEHEAYFRTKLGDIVESTAPYGLLNVKGDGAKISEKTLHLATELAEQLRSIARQHGVSTAVLFHVAWALVLSHCTGSDDVVFGTVLLGRLHGSTGAERILGMFMNTLPIRVSMVQLTVGDVVRATYQNLSDLLEHEQASLSLAQRCSGVTGSQPLFTTLLNYRHSDTTNKRRTISNLYKPEGNGEAINPSLKGIRQISHDEFTNYPITIEVDDFEHDFSITVQSVQGVNPDHIALYSLTAVEEIVDALVENPKRLISTLNILPTNELHQLLIDFNDTAVDYASEQLIHQLFERQVENYPDATALVFEGKILSYQEVNSMSNRLAVYLRSEGVGPEVLVALCVERSVEMIIGLLGILKAGGTYVPIDPDYPQERISFILEDTRTPILLTQEQLFKKLPKITTNVICFDKDWPKIERYDSNNLKIINQPSNLAYIIYTSGSTGKPKGTLVSHRNVVCSTLARFSAYPEPVKSYLLLSSFAFDSSVAGIFWTLGQGGCLYLPTDNLIKDPLALGELIYQNRITHLLTLPSFYAVLLRQITPQLKSLNTVIVAGESCPVDIIEKHQSKLPGVDLYNEYGPTEGTVWSSVYLTNNEDINQTVSIGKPIENTKIYLLNKYFAPVPIGVQGEMYLGGSGIVRGYLNQPDLTAEKFIPDPFGGSGNRLYKTGDLARYRPDGNIEFLGRIDNQVKIRGYRIELGEIEAELIKCPGIQKAIVIVREDSPGDQRLVAYLLTPNNLNLDTAGLRSRLIQVLPEYMVPSAFIVLEAYPLTPNGKLDLRALPASEVVSVILDSDEAPQGTIEIALAQIWQELLTVQHVSRNDHFFELGGHSLLVITLIERLQQQGLSLDVMTVFAAPILSEMAATIGDNEKQPSSAAVPPNLISVDCTAITSDLLPLVSLTQDEIDTIVASVPQGVANIQDIYPLAPLQEGMLFHYLLELQGDTYLSRSVISFDSRSRLDSFLTALQFVINRHDILRSAIFWKGLSQPVQVVHRQVSLPIEELKFEHDSDVLAELKFHTDTRVTRLDIDRAPLFKVFIAADSQSDKWFVSLLNHHLVRDHLTGSFIFEEIQQILNGHADKLHISLSYRNFIAQAHMVSPAVHEAYFRMQLGDITEPTAPFGVLNVYGEGEGITDVNLALSHDLAQRIRISSREQGVSPAVLFHVAWAHVLSKCTGRDDVVFGTVLLGRLQGSSGADRVLGMFMNTLPVRITLDGLSVGEVVSDTYRRLSELLDHEQASLILAQRCSGVSASLPLFTTLLNYRHSPIDTPDIGSIAGQLNDDSNNIQSAWEGIQVLRTEERTNYPIILSIDDLGQGFSITAQCVQGIDPGRIAGYLHTAIEGLADALAADAQRMI